MLSHGLDSRAQGCKWTDSVTLNCVCVWHGPQQHILNEINPKVILYQVTRKSPHWSGVNLEATSLIGMLVPPEEQ